MAGLLSYPYPPDLARRHGALRRRLLEEGGPFLEKKIAILGGPSTQHIRAMLELFLLDAGIRPVFYEGEYGMYWRDAMFPPEELAAFAPDVVFIHTTLRSLEQRPAPQDSPETAQEKLQAEYARFEQMWQALAQRFGCPIIQNNFEPPTHRLMGSRDAWDPRGLSNFASRLNQKFYDYACAHPGFYIHDIAWLAADYGLYEWASPAQWYLYKQCPAMGAVPAFAASLARMVRSLFGGNRKALALDLDNTLWGGVVGDDGVEGIEIGHETPMGEVYSEFQAYLKAHLGLGVLLAVNSKNEEANAIAGLEHPEGTLRPGDFAAIRANWEPKDRNLAGIADELNLGADALVFVDDNPAEREIVRQSGLGAAVPEMGRVEDYIRVLDQNGWFEVTAFSADDAGRARMYTENRERAAQQARFADYDAYLRSLEMRAVIRPFEAVYFPRIAQLTGKSNQFNLTTRRCTEGDIAAMAGGAGYVTLYGKLADRFGDNGLVSVAAGRLEGLDVHIELWLMSCRVLRRGMEDAMMDAFVAAARAAGARAVYGYYYRTEKNAMVKDFYGQFGFEKTREAENGDSVWRLDAAAFAPRQYYIEVET